MPSENKLHISFPKSDQDHRLQLVSVNGSIFAIIYASLESLGPIRLNCEDWSLILLAPIKSKTDIVISAINIIYLNEIISEEGSVDIYASNRLVQFAELVKSPQPICQRGEKGESQFGDDPSAFIQYYRLFEKVITHIRSANPDSFSEAQQQVLMILCSLADKIKGKRGNLDIKKVFKMWNIPYVIPCE